MVRKKMDKLSQEVAKALACSMSYGKWKATQNDTVTTKNEIPEGWLVCARCGKLFKPKTKRPQKFCEVECQKQDYYDRKRAMEQGK